jgi:hypothetical protein
MLEVLEPLQNLLTLLPRRPPLRGISQRLVIRIPTKKRMIDIDPHTQIDMELHKGNLVKDVELEEVK